MASIIIIALCVVAVAGLAVGLVKGFTKCSVWGGTVLFTVLIGKLIVIKTGMLGGHGEFAVLLTAGLLVLFILLFALTGRYLKREIAKYREMSHYKNADAREENEELILYALDNSDKKAYKKQVKRKIKDKSGPWGVVDRIFGGITVALNAAMYFIIFICFVLIIVDFAQLPSLTSVFSGVLAGGLWVNVASKIALDLLFVTLVYVCIRQGYRSGISRAVLTLLLLAMVVFAGYLSYHLAFHTELFRSLAENAANGGMSSFASSVASVTSAIGIDATGAAQCVITALLFVVMLVVVIVLAVFLPHFVERFRTFKGFAVVDGILGAVVLSVIFIAIFMFAGAVLYSLHDAAALQSFNGYMQGSLANSLYEYNPLVIWGVVDGLPFRGWFSGAEG